MCAIAGMIDLCFNEDVVQRMIKTMERRGPDGRGTYTEDGCALLHTRLAIIDPSGGTQPMKLDWGTDSYVIVYNGELYNTTELRTELISLGHMFSTNSDTEVVLRAYVQWGRDSLEKMNGIFAFAVWEKRKRKLFLARDRMGVKPLFYMLHEGGLLFSSEMKTLLQYPTVKAELDCRGVGQLLLLGPGREPGSGVLHGIYELEPGCFGEYEGSKWFWKRYWKLTDGEHTDLFEETAEKVRWLVCDAIQRQMVSDVPIGTFLSGGLDSSLISAVCAEHNRKKGDVLPTFSVDYKDSEQYFVSGKFQPDRDSSYIEIMQSFLQTQQHWSVFNPESLLSVWKEATIARDLPGMADVDFSLLLFCGDIRRHVKVALSGECADEIFGGYPWYRDPEIRDYAGFPWAQNTKSRANFLSKEYRSRIDATEYVQECYQRTIQESDILPGTTALERRMKEMMNLNCRWFMQTLLDRKDRMSMYHGLEVRVPFCDYRIAEYLYCVPWEFKEYMGREKGLLRYAMRGILPEKILYRKKSPYPKTYDPTYTKLVQTMLKELLRHKQAPIFQIVNRKELENLLTAEYVWPWYGQLMKVPQTIAYMLQLNFWMEHYAVSLI